MGYLIRDVFPHLPHPLKGDADNAEIANTAKKANAENAENAESPYLLAFNGTNHG